MGLPHLAFRRLPLVEPPRVLLGEDRHVAFLPGALAPYVARPPSGPGYRAAELLATLQELRAAIRGLLEPDSTFHADLAETVDFAAQRLHALEHRGEIDTARGGLGHDGRLFRLIRFESAPERRHLPLDITFSGGAAGHALFQGLQLLPGGGRFALELTFFTLQGLQMPQDPLRLTMGSLDVLLAGQACGFLGMNGDLQYLLTPAQRFDDPGQRLE